MNTFQINVLIRFLVSSTCLEHLVFTSRRPFVRAIIYGMFFMHLCQQSVRWKDVLDTTHLMQKAVNCREVSSTSFHLTDR